jgi:hypothetical protein
VITALSAASVAADTKPRRDISQETQAAAFMVGEAEREHDRAHSYRCTERAGTLIKRSRSRYRFPP